MSDISQSAKDEAVATGMVIVKPGPRDLQLDIDSDGDLAWYEAHKGWLSGPFKVERERRTKSKGGNVHIHITLASDISKAQRIALQACLGSDRKRELLSLTSTETLLFELPAEAEAAGLKVYQEPTRAGGTVE